MAARWHPQGRRLFRRGQWPGPFGLSRMLKALSDFRLRLKALSGRQALRLDPRALGFRLRALSCLSPRSIGERRHPKDKWFKPNTLPRGGPRNKNEGLPRLCRRHITRSTWRSRSSLALSRLVRVSPSSPTHLQSRTGHGRKRRRVSPLPSGPSSAHGWPCGVPIAVTRVMRQNPYRADSIVLIMPRL